MLYVESFKRYVFIISAEITLRKTWYLDIIPPTMHYATQLVWSHFLVYIQTKEDQYLKEIPKLPC